MKACFYMILSRPRGSKCWLPVELRMDERNLGNFFGSRATALRIAMNIARHTKPVFLWGIKEWAPLEFKVAQVIAVSPIPDFTSPDPSPNLKPPASNQN